MEFVAAVKKFLGAIGMPERTRVNNFIKDSHDIFRVVFQKYWLNTAAKKKRKAQQVRQPVKK